MFNGKRINLVLPCYNEEKGLSALLTQKPSFIDIVTVVDNNSTDQTSTIARQFGAKVVLVQKKGYGLACQAGVLEASSADITIMMDGDNTYPINEIENILNIMEKNHYDFISGCRFPLKDKKAMPIIKQFSNRIISGLIRSFFHIPLIDSQSGMIIFKSHLTKSILSLNPGMGFSQEIKIKACTNPSIKSAEVLITYAVRSGEVKFRALQDGMKVLSDLMVYKFKNINVFNIQTV